MRIFNVIAKEKNAEMCFVIEVWGDDGDIRVRFYDPHVKSGDYQSLMVREVLDATTKPNKKGS